MAKNCMECDAEPNPKYNTYVEQRPTNQIDPSMPDMLCTHCWEGYLREHTGLSAQEAQVASLKSSGLTHGEVADATATDRSQIGTVVGRIRDKLEQARRTTALVTHPDEYGNGGGN